MSSLWKYLRRLIVGALLGQCFFILAGIDALFWGLMARLTGISDLRMFAPVARLWTILSMPVLMAAEAHFGQAPIPIFAALGLYWALIGIFVYFAMRRVIEATMRWRARRPS